jgi:hypothetical protein
MDHATVGINNLAIGEKRWASVEDPIADDPLRPPIRGEVERLPDSGGLLRVRVTVGGRQTELDAEVGTQLGALVQQAHQKLFGKSR